DQFAQQQRQAAVAMQAEVAKVQSGTTPAPAAPAVSVTPKEAVAAPPPVIPPATVPMATIPNGTFPAAPAGLSAATQLLQQKKYAEARPRLNTVLAASPRNETALKLRVAADLSLSRFAEARTDIDALLRMKPNDSPMLASRSVASIGMKQLDQAMIDANQAL